VNVGQAAGLPSVPGLPAAYPTLV